MSTIAPTADRNPGIVPPWLANPEPRNPGIVPPWLRDEVHILPIDTEPEFTILPVSVGGDTTFVRESASISPMTLADVLRSR